MTEVSSDDCQKKKNFSKTAMTLNSENYKLKNDKQEQD